MKEKKRIKKERLNEERKRERWIEKKMIASKIEERGERKGKLARKNDPKRVEKTED